MFCQNVKPYIYVPDDSVAYKAGVDVNGNPVLPADLGTESVTMLPEKYVFPVTLDMARRLGESLNHMGVGLEAVVGTVQIYPDGRIMYDEKDISEKVKAICYSDRAEKKENTKQED